MTFDNSDSFLLFACKQSLGFIPVRNENSSLIELTSWGDNNYSLLCLGSQSQAVVAGLQNGRVISFKPGSMAEAGNPKGAMLDKQTVTFMFNSVLNGQHSGPCSAIWSRKNDRGFLTGGYDGSILIWDSQLNNVQSIKLQDDPKMRISSNKIKSICEDLSGEIYVGTKAGDLFEVSISGAGGQCKSALKGHLGAISCIDRLGSKDEVVSVGQDKNLIIWEIGKNKEKKVVPLEFEGYQVACSLEGIHIAVGFTNGYVEIIESTNTSVIKKIKDRTCKIVLLKYSSTMDNSFLAAGGEDCEIILYKAKEAYKMHIKIKGLSGPPCFLDFSQDYSTIRIVDMGFNLRFYSVNDKKKKTESLHELKETKWVTNSCPISWETHGLFNDPSVLAGITCQAVSPDKKLLAVGMISGDIRFYRYPCIGNNPPYINFTAHSSPVTKLIFCDASVSNTSPILTLVSIGLKDRNIIVWKYTPSEDKGQGPLISSGTIDKDEFYYVSLMEGSSKDKSVLPKHEILVDPKAFNTDNWNISKRQVEAPDQNLELKHVFGCKFEGVVNFAKFTASSSVVFFSGNKAIVEEVTKDTKTQTFFTHHRHDIICLDLHKNKELVATGELAPKGQRGKVFVWHYHTKVVSSALTATGFGGVIKVRFSSEGTKLLVVSNDNYHTLDVFDYMNNRLITSVHVDEQPILELSFKSDNDFVSLTSTGVRFWELKGTNLISTRGDWKPIISEKDTKKEEGASFQPEILVSCLYAFLQNICVTGTAKGNLYTWQNYAYHKQVTAHEKAVRLMHCFKNILYTCGDDGIIKTWSYSGKLIAGKQIAVHVPMEKSVDFEIRSIDISPDSLYLIGTNIAKLFIHNDSSSSDTSYTPVCESHASEGINAIAVHPTTAQFITAAKDGRIIKWDVVTKSCTSYKIQLKDPSDCIVALDWSQNGEFFAAATAKGSICLLDKSLTLKENNLLESIFNKPDQRITVIKISPNFSRLAVSAENSTQIQFFDINEKDLRITIGGTLKGELNAGCRFLDWTDDGEFIACTLDSFEIKFGMMKDMNTTNYTVVKDKLWTTWTQPLGPTVKGIRLDDREIKYSPVCRSYKFVTKAKDYETEIDKKPVRLFLATGDRDGNLSLYRYPSVYPNSDSKSYNALARNLTQVRIFSNDGYVVAIGDKDNSIAVFETDFKNDAKMLDNVEAVLGGELEESGADPNAESIPRQSAQAKLGSLRKEEQGGDNRDVALMHKEDQGMIDKQKFSKPWMASIRYPTDYLKPPINSEKAPKLRLKPVYVFGFRAKDTRDNLRYLNQNEIVYATGSMLILHNTRNNTQRFFTEHKADVSCFSVRQSPLLVASGDVGEVPMICVWNPESLATIKIIHATALKGLAKIQFAPEGPYLATLSVDDHSTIAVFNYATGILLHSAPGDGRQQRVHDLKWTAMNELVSVGINHIKFWKVEANQLRGTRGKLDPKNGPQRIVCCAINKKDVLGGTVRGDLLVWRRSLGPDPPQIFPLMSDKQEKGPAIECINVTDQK
jgi:WD40 repeat protein